MKTLELNNNKLFTQQIYFLKINATIFTNTDGENHLKLWKLNYCVAFKNYSANLWLGCQHITLNLVIGLLNFQI